MCDLQLAKGWNHITNVRVLSIQIWAQNEHGWYRVHQTIKHICFEQTKLWLGNTHTFKLSSLLSHHNHYYISNGWIVYGQHSSTIENIHTPCPYPWLWVALNCASLLTIYMSWPANHWWFSQPSVVTTRTPCIINVASSSRWIMADHVNV